MLPTTLIYLVCFRAAGDLVGFRDCVFGMKDGGRVVSNWREGFQNINLNMWCLRYDRVYFVREFFQNNLIGIRKFVTSEYAHKVTNGLPSQIYVRCHTLIWSDFIESVFFLILLICNPVTIINIPSSRMSSNPTSILMTSSIWEHPN